MPFATLRSPPVAPQSNEARFPLYCYSMFIHNVATEVIFALHYGSVLPHVQIFRNSLGPFGIISATIIGCLCTFAIRLYPSNRTAQLFVEFASFSNIFVPLLCPFKVLRFFYGVYLFAAFLSLHSRVLTNIKTKIEVVSTSSPLDSVQVQLLTSTSVTRDLLRTWFYNIQEKLTKISPRTPTLARIQYWILSWLVLDSCMFAIHEWIPFHIAARHQLTAKALVAGYVDALSYC